MAKEKIETVQETAENAADGNGKEESNKREKVDRHIYLGPTLKKGQYKYGKITKGLPKDLEAYFEEKPGLEMLFVKAEHLAEAKADLNAGTSALKSVYQDILKWVKEGGK